MHRTGSPHMQVTARDVPQGCGGWLEGCVLYCPQGERRQQAAAQLGLLNGLWEVLEIGTEDVDRTIFTGLLTNPAPMHRQTLDKVRHPPLCPFRGPAL